LKPQLDGDLPDPCDRPEPPRPGVAHDQEDIRFSYGTPADVFHAGLGVDYEKTVIPLKLLHTFREEIICKTVAPGAFRPAHSNEVEAVCLHKRLSEPVPHVIVPVHARWDVPGKSLFPHAAQCLFHLNTKGLVEVRVRVSINGKDRDLAGIDEGPDKKGTHRGLAGPAFSGERNGKRVSCH